MPEKVPLWIIRNSFLSYGSKMPDRPPTMSAELKFCETCGGYMYNFNEWTWCDGLYYCNKCIIDARRKERAKWDVRDRTVTHYPRPGIVTRFTEPDLDSEESLQQWLGGGRRMSVTNPVRTYGEVPDGNLPEVMYAFWIGSLRKYTNGVTGHDEYSLRSTCRACGMEAYNQMRREQHKKESSAMYTDDMSCYKVLNLAYAELLKLDECLVCHSKCYGRQKWGAPLCCPNCVKTWKFDETMNYESLEVALSQYWATGKAATGGSATSGSTSNLISMSTPADEGKSAATKSGS